MELRILVWDGLRFTGTMTYPDDGTVISVTGQAGRRPGSAGVRLSWRERDYIKQGRRAIDLSGEYEGTVTGNYMDADWHRGSQPIVQFTMTAEGDS